MRSLARIFLIFIFCHLFFPFALGADPEILVGRDYYRVLKESISVAKEEIVVAMYFIIEDRASQDNPVGDLINELIQAHLRGVKVRVILEDTKFNENSSAYERLVQAGVEVYFDTPARLLHCKVIIIDNNIVVLGSTNWTRAAFLDNYEAACLFRSKEKVSEIKSGLLDKINLSPSPPVDSELNGVSIPASLLLSEMGLSRLVRERSEKSFDLYLLFLNKDVPENEKIYLDYVDLHKKLGYIGEINKALARERVRRAAMILARTYGLIEYDPAGGWVIVRFPELNQSGFPSSITLPFAYWEYGLNRRLSLSAKYMYLASLLEAKRSTKKPYWFRSQADMASFYHISDNTVSLALQELEREELVEVTRSTSPGDEYGGRKANVYRINPLISPLEREEAIDALEIKYGEDMVNKAQGFSRVLNEPYDLADIETFISLIRTYGYQAVLKANKQTALYKKGSGLFNITTTVDSLRNLRD